MKKTLIAAAVAAVVAAPAFADVSVSGALQTELVLVGGDAASKNGVYMQDAMANGTSSSGNAGRLDFKASEDLGDGMKAIAHYALNITTDNFGGASREAYVGLSGGFGTVLAGKMNRPYKTTTVGWDPMLATSFQARGNGAMQWTLHGAEVSNALAYANTFGSVKVVGALVVDEAAKASDDTYGNHAVELGVNAPVGPVELAVGYSNADKTGSATSTNLIATKVGVKWVSGDITVAGQYEMLDKGYTAGTDKSNIMYLTGSYKMGSNTVSASYGKTDKKVTGGTKDTTYMAVMLNHGFSKNTSGYVGYRSTDAALKETAFGAGLRVKF